MYVFADVCSNKHKQQLIDLDSDRQKKGRRGEWDSKLSASIFWSQNTVSMLSLQFHKLFNGLDTKKGFYHNLRKQTLRTVYGSHIVLSKGKYTDLACWMN